MPRRTYKCSSDRFSLVFDELTQDILRDVESAGYQSVSKAVKHGVKEVRKNAKAYGWKKYPTGFRGTTTKRKLLALGEIGNAKYPGLVHLLEKGHAKMGGGRTRAFDHMGKASEETFELFYEDILQNVGRTL